MHNRIICATERWGNILPAPPPPDVRFWPILLKKSLYNFFPKK
ncbi:hypothetical protein PACF725_2366 [Pseudomonas aeruginosa]|nr:hypothetical protein PACF725_2366 [Pseudomonas aeruginosa]